MYLGGVFALFICIFGFVLYCIGWHSEVLRGIVIVIVTITALEFLVE